MKKCFPEETPTCDFCCFFQAAKGYCILHNKAVDDNDGCDDFECVRFKNSRDKNRRGFR
jgi:hypothetical protein